MVKLKRVLVANRGEIALRIIRACHEEGLEAVAVYSEADARSPHILHADFAVEIGPAPAAQSYLDVNRLVEAARKTGADAIHPGYGFLSERALFAQAVEDAGLVFIGPPPGAIRAMGEKTEARRRMAAAGVPVVPGTTEPVPNASEATRIAAEPGLPVLIKEAAVLAARSVGYLGAGTVEFLLDPGGRFFFLEMNTRIQVEHPVTELVYGVDLVREQLRVAGGEPTTLPGRPLTPRGHAIECRI